MDKVLIMKGENGALRVVHKARKGSLSWDQMINLYLQEGETSRLALLTDLPKDRYFRNAWRDDQPGEQVDIDLAAAKELQIDKLRQYRAERFVDLDRSIMIAMETGKVEETATLALKKQGLREMPDIATLALAEMTDLEAIKILSLEDLGL